MSLAVVVTITLELILQEGIVLTFVTHARGRAVARVNGDVVAEGKQLCFDRIDQSLIVATGKVGTANTAVEKDVAGNDEFILPTVEADTAW